MKIAFWRIIALELLRRLLRRCWKISIVSCLLRAIIFLASILRNYFQCLRVFRLFKALFLSRLILKENIISSTVIIVVFVLILLSLQIYWILIKSMGVLCFIAINEWGCFITSFIFEISKEDQLLLIRCITLISKNSFITSSLLKRWFIFLRLTYKNKVAIFLSSLVLLALPFLLHFVFWDLSLILFLFKFIVKILIKINTSGNCRMLLHNCNLTE